MLWIWDRKRIYLCFDPGKQYVAANGNFDCELLKKFNWQDMTALAAAFISSALWGGRRMFLVLAVFVVLKVIFDFRYQRKSLKILFMLLAIVAFLAGIFLQYYINADNQYSSRTLSIVKSGNFFMIVVEWIYILLQLKR